MLHAPPRNTERSVIEKAQNVFRTPRATLPTAAQPEKIIRKWGGKVPSAWAVDLFGTNFRFLFYFVLPFLEKGGGPPSVTLEDPLEVLSKNGRLLFWHIASVLAPAQKKNEIISG